MYMYPGKKVFQGYLVKKSIPIRTYTYAVHGDTYCTDLKTKVAMLAVSNSCNNFFIITEERASCTIYV